MDVKDLVAVISGGASGLGEGCVRSLVKDGAKVSILDCAEEKGEKIAADIGDSVIFCNTDIVDEKAVQVAIDKTMESFGAIHVAVNCAGVGISAKVLGREGPMTMEHFNKVLQINLMGTMNVIRLAAEKMVKNIPNEDGEKGVVINTSSGAAFEGQVGQAAYSASKAAIVGMTLPIAREFAGYGIRIVTVAPGAFDTPMMAGLAAKAKEALAKTIPFPSRMGKPSEFAQLVKQIIENPMLNGATIRIDAALRMAAR
jgi:3-hydroxyacyl-CoA dehydrogenase/3-hydroxy-2-methylbutyryl-CoA dehydrogenase